MGILVVGRFFCLIWFDFLLLFFCCWFFCCCFFLGGSLLLFLILTFIAFLAILFLLEFSFLFLRRQRDFHLSLGNRLVKLWCLISEWAQVQLAIVRPEGPTGTVSQHQPQHAELCSVPQELLCQRLRRVGTLWTLFSETPHPVKDVNTRMQGCTVLVVWKFCSLPLTEK